MCDLEQCIEQLYGNPSLADGMCYTPERHYSDEAMESRVYNGMQTGDFWWELQVCLSVYSMVVWSLRCSAG